MELRGSGIDESFVVGTLGGKNPLTLHSSTPPIASLLIVRSAILNTAYFEVKVRVRGAR